MAWKQYLLIRCWDRNKEGSYLHTQYKFPLENVLESSTREPEPEDDTADHADL